MSKVVFQFQSFGSNSYRYEWDQMRLALGELSEDDNITVDQILGQESLLVNGW